MTDRERKLNDSWQALQGEITALLQGAAAPRGEGEPAESAAALEARAAAAAAAAFTAIIPHATAGPAAEETFAAQLGTLRGGLVRCDPKP